MWSANGRRLASAAVLLIGVASCGDDSTPPDGADVSVDLTDAGSDVQAPDAAADSAADAAPDSASDAASEVDGQVVPLVAVAVVPRHVDLNATVTLDASGSTGATKYTWNLSDGRVFGPSSSPTVEVPFTQEGRVRATLTVENDSREKERADGLVTVTAPPAFAPRRSGSIAVLADGDRVAVVSPDSDEVSIFAGLATGTLSLEARYATCRGPRNVAQWQDWLAISCPSEDRVALLDTESGSRTDDLELPWGSRPFGIVADDEGRLLVVQQGAQALAIFDTPTADTPQVSLGPDPRGVTLLPDHRAAITRWRSDEVGEITVVDLNSLTLETPIALAYDDVRPSDTESGGVPTYLDHLAVSPNGRDALVPALQANVGYGLYLADTDITHETTVRAVVGFINLADGSEDPDRRKRFDDRGLPSSAVYSPRGDYIYIAMRGSRALERLDAFNNAASGSQTEVGFAPQDVAISPDGTLLLVDAYLSRELVVIDAHGFGATFDPLQRLSLVSSEPLSEELLRGKQLFNDSFDVRLTQDSYVACAHCHLDGETDRQTWDFTGRGEGMRNTITLLGRAGMGHGPVHWSANFDEIQDFEHDIRGPFAGTGLLDDADFFSGDHDRSLGAPKAGLSPDLDALAAYVSSLDTFPRSPFRDPTGALTESAQRGRMLFESTETGCTSCHSGDAMTDSALVDGVPVLHDVGTLSDASGMRLNGELTGLDTPTLRGVWNTAPYLHDGSAPTLRAAIEAGGGAHGVTTGFDDADWDDLTAYLLSLE